MQLKQAHQEVQSEGIETSKTMAIADDPIIWRFLTDQLYTQKNAWIREYAQNARDVDPNWRIALPSLHTTECQFIDNGPGMSKEFMLNQFCQAGFSTKRNNNNQSGGFGIGRLSGPQGTLIECRNEDAIRTWALIKNKDSIPSVSLMSEIDRPDDVPIGTTVRVPVKPGEIEAVKKDVFKFLRFYGLPGLPEIKYIIKRPTWAIVDMPQDYGSGENPTMVEVGGYTFKAKYNEFSSAATHLSSDDRSLLDRIYKGGYGAYILVHVPVGSVNIALNRESIKFDEETVNTLLKAAKIIQSEMVQTANLEMDKAKNKWDALLQYQKLASSDFGGLWGSIKRLIKWRGATLDSNMYDIDLQVHRVTAENYRHRGRRNNANGDDLPLNVRPPMPDSRSDKAYLTPRALKDGGIWFVAVDTDDAVSRRLRAQFTRKDEVWFIHPPRDTNMPPDPNFVPPPKWWEKFIDSLDAENGDGFQFTKLSDITPLPVAQRVAALPGSPKTTMVRNKFFAMNSNYTSFEPFDVDLADKTPLVWVPYHRDDVEPGEKTDKVEHLVWHKQGSLTPKYAWRDAHPSIHTLRNLFPTMRIVGVPRSQRHNIQPHWTHLCDHVIKNLPPENEWPEIMARSGEFGNHWGVAEHSLIQWVRETKKRLEAEQPKHPLVKLVDAAVADYQVTQLARQKYPILRLFVIPFTEKMKKDVKLRNFEKEIKDMVAGSPALSILTKVGQHSLSAEELKFLLELA